MPGPFPPAASATPSRAGTTASLLGNIPLAMLLVASAKLFTPARPSPEQASAPGQRRRVRPASSPAAVPPGEDPLPPLRSPPPPTDWREAVGSDVVAHAWHLLCGSIVQEVGGVGLTRCLHQARVFGVGRSWHPEGMARTWVSCSRQHLPLPATPCGAVHLRRVVLGRHARLRVPRQDPGPAKRRLWEAGRALAAGRPACCAERPV